VQRPPRVVSIRAKQAHEPPTHLFRQLLTQLSHLPRGVRPSLQFEPTHRPHAHHQGNDAAGPRPMSLAPASLVAHSLWSVRETDASPAFTPRNRWTTGQRRPRLLARFGSVRCEGDAHLSRAARLRRSSRTPGVRNLPTQCSLARRASTSASASPRAATCRKTQPENPPTSTPPRRTVQELATGKRRSRAPSRTIPRNEPGR
jgi:hypothetical protein